MHAKPLIATLGHWSVTRHDDSIASDSERGGKDGKCRSMLVIVCKLIYVCPAWAPPPRKMNGNMHKFRRDVVNRCSETAEAGESKGLCTLPLTHYVRIFIRGPFSVAENPNAIIFLKDWCQEGYRWVQYRIQNFGPVRYGRTCRTCMQAGAIQRKDCWKVEKKLAARWM